jgi:cytochrome c oxidase cbb3-type subunit 2
MNRLPSLFMGCLGAFTLAWVALIVIPYGQVGQLQPQVNEELGESLPPEPAGLTHQGERVYAANGCIYCHTQQTRPRSEGSDIDRGWGVRGSVARDYIYENRVFLGSTRIGPDLANVGAERKTGPADDLAMARQLLDPQWHFRHLYNPRGINSDSIMPAFRYLFVARPINGKKSNDALDLTGEDAPPPGYEVVPTHEAKALVAYLLSLNQSYALKEAPVK